jgi:hypothetical protein
MPGGIEAVHFSPLYRLRYGRPGKFSGLIEVIFRSNRGFSRLTGLKKLEVFRRVS